MKSTKKNQGKTGHKKIQPVFSHVIIFLAINIPFGVWMVIFTESTTYLESDPKISKINSYPFAHNKNNKKIPNFR